MTKLTASLLRRANRISAKAYAVQHELTAAFRDRYGLTYSDVDCDAIIDILDYGGGVDLTVADCDRLMADCGAPPLPATPTDQVKDGKGGGA